MKNKTYATNIPLWEGDTGFFVSAPSEQAAAIRRGKLEVESDPTTAGCFESGLEIEVVDASSDDEPSHFRVYTTAEPVFHAQRTDDA